MTDFDGMQDAPQGLGNLEETIVALRRSEALLRFLDHLSKKTANLADADGILAVTTKMVGEYLGISVCAYADMDEDENGFTIRGDWSAPGSTSIVGHYHLADFGRLAVQNLNAGEPLVVNDNLKELAPHEAATFQKIGIAATICMPLAKNGRLEALMAIHDKVPRIWTADELSLIREVTERSWAHVERVGAEASLRDSEARLRELNADLERTVIQRTQARGKTWQISPDLLGALNSEGYFETSNPAWKSVLGWTEDEVASMSIWEMLHPDDVERTRVGFALTQIGQPAIRFPNRYRCKDGNHKWISWVGIPDEGLVYCSGRDITAERAAEAERDQLWTLSEDMLARANYEGKMSAVNPAWSRVLGYSERELLTNPYTDIIHPEDIGTTVAALGDMERTGRPTRFENRILAINGDWKPIGWTVSPEPDGRNFIAVGRDLANYKAREKELADTLGALRQAQKMEAIGQLTGGVAHDFNNLLMAVTGSLELLRKRMPEDAVLHRLLENAMAGAQRGAVLTKRMLAFARKQDLKSERTDLVGLVGGMTELLGRTLGPLIAIATEFPAELPAVDIDAGQLESALLNLAVNARDAMRGQGTIRISAYEETVGTGAKLRPGHYVCLSVADTGEGMDEETLRRAAEPFFTTKGIGKGTGLGLSMAHGFADQSGGALVLHSKVGSGTTAEIWLPAFSGFLSAGAPPTADVFEPAGAAHAPSNHLRILAVDDDALVLMNTVAMLEDLGHEVVSAYSASNALDAFRQEHFDLVITDQAMPDKTGVQLAGELRGHRPNIPIILATGYAELPPGTDIGLPKLSKPFSQADLEAAVKDVTAR